MPHLPRRVYTTNHSLSDIQAHLPFFSYMPRLVLPSIEAFCNPHIPVFFFAHIADNMYGRFILLVATFTLSIVAAPIPVASPDNLTIETVIKGRSEILPRVVVVDDKRQTISDDGNEVVSHKRQTISDDGNEVVGHKRQTISDEGDEVIGHKRQTISDEGNEVIGHKRQNISDEGDEVVSH
ncbi:uncharacterized protein BDR25DRAFT_340623 [Lindgomyces ingoldianus]|uniref:Uncharacterized protein n=1 Tax=Lindgomyces ingoldianus TaxID=673940 RepID=A0ACB6R883_9PLEO|nr:uncharacterized protein BDR25DRAFT_340623 [Lindgomyces ingoldianus]KAF2474998.1 hypothetical protein BDR25DRAFT_340623 [Lindgomyces ingoldianus]